MKTRKTQLLASVCAAVATLFGAQQTFAAASVTTATGGAAISVDNVGGAYVSLTGPVITETDNTGMPTGTMILTAPSGFQFDTTANSVSVAITGTGTGTDATLTAATVTPTTSTITVTVSAISSSTRRTIFTYSGIKVRPTGGSLIAPANITYSGTSSGITGGTALGALTVIPGAPTQLAFTTQPAGATYGAAFTTQPVVRTRDQFGNSTTNGLPATLNVSLALTTGTGPLTGTTILNVGTSGTPGVAAFSGLALGTVETGVVITASASGFNTPNSTAFNVTPKNLTVTGITASNKIYDQTTIATLNTGSATLVGVLAGDTLTVDTAVATGTFSSATVGNNKTVTVAGLTLTGAPATNYALTQPTTTANITAKPLTVNGVTANNKVYNGNTAATLITAGSSLVGVIGGDTVTLGTGGATGAFATKAVGSAKTVTISGLSISGGSAANYSLTQPTATADITAATLTVTATGVNRAYDGTTNATITLANNRVSGDTVTVTNEAASFATKTVGTSKAVTVSGIGIAGGTDGGNYSLGNTTAATTANITTRALTVSGITATNKVYDRTTTATIDPAAAILNNVISGEDATLDTVAALGTFASNTVGNNKTINITGLTLTGADAANYTITAPTTVANITAKPLTVSGATASNKTYSGTTAATVSATGATLVGLISPDTATLNSGSIVGTFADKNVGTNKVVTISGLTITGGQSANYSLTQPSTNANITERSLTITATGVNRIYDGSTNAAVTLTDNKVSGDVITASYATASFPDKNVGTGKTVNVSGISISGAGAANYTLANTTETTTANITALPVQLTGARSYDGSTEAAASILAISNDFDGGNVTLAGNATLVGKNVGTQAIASVGAPVRVRSTTGSVNSGTSISMTALSGAPANGNTLVAIISTRGTAQSQVTGITQTGATWTRVVQSGAGASTASTTEIWYAPNVSSAGTAITINLANSLRAAAVVAEYNGLVTPTSVDATNSNFSSGTASTTASTGTTPTTSQGNELWIGGIGLVSSSQTLSSLQNSFAEIANVSSGSGTAANNARIYALERFATATGTAASGGTVSSSAQWSGAIATFKAAQVAAPLSLAGSAAANYTLTGVSGSVSITTKALTTTGLTANNKFYDGNTTASLSGTAALLATEAPGAGTVSDGKPYTGDVVAVSATPAGVFADKQVGLAKTVTISGLTLSGAQAGNYSLTQPTGVTANINPLVLTGNITAASKVYDGNVSATIVSNSLSGIIGADDVSLTGGTATFADKQVGVGKLVTASGFGLSGADAANYSAPTSVATSADITARALVVTATGANKVYDGTTTAAVTMADNRISGDVFSTSSSANFADANVGAGKLISVTGISLTGVDAVNYAANSATAATADITAKGLTVSGLVANNKVYDGNLSASLNTAGATLVGVINLDAVTLDFSAAAGVFADAVVGTGKPVNISGLTITSNPNYTLTQPPATATITAAPLTITADNKTRAFGTANPTFTATVNGFVNSETASVLNGTMSFSTLATNNSPSGTYPISVSGSTAANYAITFVAGNLTVLSEGLLFSDNFTRDTDPGSLSPWLTNAGLWTVTGGELIGGPNISSTYEFAYIPTNWVNYSVEAKLKLPAGAFGAGLGGRLDANTGAHYAAWIYPEGSVGGSNMLRLIKFSDWSNWTLLQSVNLGAVGTNAHTLKLSFVGSQIVVAVDATPLINVTDATLVSGGITVDAWTDAVPYVMSVDDVLVNQLKDEQTISFSALANKTYGDSSFGLSATASSSLPVSFSIVSGPATMTETNVTLTGAGAVIVRAAQSGNANFNAAPPVDQSFEVVPAPVTGSITATSKVYDGNDVAVIVTRSLTGVIGSDDVSLTGGTAVFVDKNVGAAKTVFASGLSLSGAHATNYSLTSTSASTTAGITAVSLTGSITASSKVYDGSAAATIASRSLTGVIGLDDVALSGGVASFADKNVGTTKPVSVSGLSVTGADAGNYTLANATASSSADITARALTISAAAASKVYDGNSDTTVTLSDDRMSGDVLTAGYTGASFDNKNVGATKPVSISGISVSGADMINYNLANTTASSSAAITARPLTITATAQNKVYDGSTNVVVSLADNRISGDGLTTANADAGFDDANAGTVKNVNILGLSISGTDAGNYALATASAVATADIAPVQLTVTADNKSRAYGVANPNFTATITGFVNGETNDVISGSAQLTTLAETNSSVGNYPIAAVLGTLSATNYAFSFVDGSLTIAPFALTVSADNKFRTYGAVNPGLTGSLTGLQNSDNITASYATSANTNSPVGGYPITVSLADPDGKLANYSVITNEGLLTVSAATLTVTASNQARIYGAANPTLSSTITGFVNGEDNSVLNGSAALSTVADAASAVGGYPITAALGTLSAANYTFSFVDGSLTITAASLTPSITANNKVYDGNNSAAIATRSLTGVIGSDEVSLVGGTASFADKNVGTGKVVSATGLSLNGADAGNYNLAASGATTAADITAASLTASVTAANKAYDGNNTAALSSRSLTGVIGSDDVSLTGGTATFNDKNVGGGKPVVATGLSLSGANAANYSLASSSASTTADITAITLTVTADDKSRNYGDANPALTGTLIGGIAGDNITASYSTLATVASPAGNYAITPALNDPDNNLGNYLVTANNGTLTIISLAPSTIGGIEKLADGNMHIVVTGTPGQVYHLQAIGDLNGAGWSNISTNTANGLGVVEFDDRNATNHISRFYRISTP